MFGLLSVIVVLALAAVWATGAGSTSSLSEVAPAAQDSGSTYGQALESARGAADVLER